MIHINKINRIYPILYMGVPYTIVETEAVLDDDTNTTVKNFSTENLAIEMLDISGLPKNSEAMAIDDDIYGYIPEHVFKKPEHEICEWISEHFD